MVAVTRRLMGTLSDILGGQLLILGETLGRLGKVLQTRAHTLPLNCLTSWERRGALELRGVVSHAWPCCSRVTKNGTQMLGQKVAAVSCLVSWALLNQGKRKIMICMLGREKKVLGGL